ncbi:hypothetical protein [Actinomadura macrotermitis]|uniref:Lipoprotein n=1 Tax=Actinomadura macrotermitis TaxID=2585200 RepID=A0A7K0BTK4_9ACTN|nr:hypothetical protein [Actinomadura macrotermitis]MQY04481.1 hypothetical protein [Actinomadura macrotermitis]
MRTRQRIAALALLPALLFGTSACFWDGGGKNAATGPGKGTDNAEQGRKFAKCMREHGVDMPDPDADGKVKMKAGDGHGVKGGQVPEGGIGKLEQAEKACRHLAPNGGKPPSKGDIAAMQKHAKCMREHGVNMPDPDSSGKVKVERKAGEGDGGPAVDPESAEFKSAEKACRQLEPKRPGGDEKGLNGSKE